METGPARVVLETNVFVAAGLNSGSYSAQLVEALRDGRLRMLWDDAKHAEIEHVMRQIPRLSWTRIADLFRSEDRFSGSTHPKAFGIVPDPADRKFAALADAAQHTPVGRDVHQHTHAPVGLGCRVTSTLRTLSARTFFGPQIRLAFWKSDSRVTRAGMRTNWRPLTEK
jgi:predicted nucleic acid-binding protein